MPKLKRWEMKSTQALINRASDGFAPRPQDEKWLRLHWAATILVDGEMWRKPTTDEMQWAYDTIREVRGYAFSQYDEGALALTHADRILALGEELETRVGIMDVLQAIEWQAEGWDMGDFATEGELLALCLRTVRRFIHNKETSLERDYDSAHDDENNSTTFYGEEQHDPAWLAEKAMIDEDERS